MNTLTAKPFMHTPYYLDTIPTLTKDVYKESHVKCVQIKVDNAYSAYTSRFGKYTNVPGGTYAINLGMQGFWMDFLVRVWNEFFFQLPVEEAVAKHIRMVNAAVPGDHNFDHLVELHELGYLPLHIKQLPEGAKVPYGVAAFTIKTTKPGFAWLGQSLETVMSTDVWPMSTSATTSHAFLENFRKFAEYTGLDAEMVNWQAHDFSMRGLFTRHASGPAGFSHLAAGNYGTDTFPAIEYAEAFYGANLDEEIVGGSINATEHFVMCMGAGKEDSFEYYEELITKIYPSGPLSIVCDSKDFWKVVTEYFPRLKDVIMARDGFVVVRPDSGDPVKVILGEALPVDELNSQTWKQAHAAGGYVLKDDSYYQAYGVGAVGLWRKVEDCKVPPEQKGLIKCLWDIFGGTVTAKGFRLLDEHISAIYGDSITLDRQVAILQGLADRGYASKIVLGIGSYSYQYVTRDTHGSAMKGLWVQLKTGEGMAIQKDPKTDPTKKSASGLLRVELEDGEYVQYDDQTEEQEKLGELKTIFLDGQIVNPTTLAEIRARLS